MQVTPSAPGGLDHCPPAGVSGTRTGARGAILVGRPVPHGPRPAGSPPHDTGPHGTGFPEPAYGTAGTPTPPARDHPSPATTTAPEVCHVAPAPPPAPPRAASRPRGDRTRRRHHPGRRRAAGRRRRGTGPGRRGERSRSAGGGHRRQARDHRPRPCVAHDPQGRAKTLPARVFGLAVPGAPTELSEADALASSLGRRATQLTFYSSWHYAADFPTADARRVASTGAVPEVTWEPWDPAVGTPDQPAYSLDRIAGGAFDAYVTRWAQQVKAYGAPVAFRFAHEMNGSWYPWSEGVNGNTSGDYVAAWRRVVGIFRSVGATNALWTGPPTCPSPVVALPGLYPGDRWVDRVGLDGYNWAGLIPSTSWQSFGEVFGPGLAQLTSLTAKPVFIGEVGCPEGVGDKAGWIRDMWAYLDQHREVRGLTWFHFQKEADWRITSSQASHDAFRAGVGAFAS